MPLGVLIIGELKQLICEAVGKPTSPQPVRVRDEMCSSEVNGGGPEAYRSMPGQIEAR